MLQLRLSRRSLVRAEHAMVGPVERLYTLRLVAATIVVLGPQPPRMKADSTRYEAEDKPAVPAQPALQLS